MANTWDYKSNFDLDRGIEDFHRMIEWYGDDETSYESYIRSVVEAQFDNPTQISVGYYFDCIRRLTNAIGGYQMRMELK